MRGPEREHAILDAVLALLAEVGYERMSVDAVAARARASKATIYRRWPGKPAMVKAALDRLDTGRLPPPPDTGSLRGDLLAVMRALAALATPEHVALTAGLAAAMRTNPELAAALQAHVDEPDQQPFRPVVLRAAARGWGVADPAVVDEVAEALVIRRLQLGLALDEAFHVHVVDHVLARLFT
jgi:AcrR family transcriptional regulator